MPRSKDPEEYPAEDVIPADDEPEEAPPTLESDERPVLHEMAALAQRLARAARDADEEARVADRVFGLLNRLDKPAQQRLFSRPEVREMFDLAADADVPAKRDDPPGTIYYRTIQGEKVPWSKKPWSWADVRARFPAVTFVPEKQQNIIWNGLALTVFRRRPNTVPSVFHDQYVEGLRAEELAEQHAAWLMKKGPVPSDPSIITPDGARSRAIANHDGRVNIYAPGGGVPAFDPPPEAARAG